MDSFLQTLQLHKNTQTWELVCDHHANHSPLRKLSTRPRLARSVSSSPPGRRHKRRARHIGSSSRPTVKRSSSFDEQFVMCHNSHNLRNATMPKRRISLERQEDSILRNAIQPLRQESDETIALPQLPSIYDDSQLAQPKGTLTTRETSMGLIANAIDSICLNDTFFLDDSFSSLTSTSRPSERLPSVPKATSMP